MTTFQDLGLAAPLLETLATEGYASPTPIQAQAIPHVLAGRDLLGIAQTGTGKTAAFALPILQRLATSGTRAPARGCRALVLAPTRELAGQINDSFRVYGRGMGFASAVVFGGVGAGPQIKALMRGLDILVATPGRLLDHFDQRMVRLDHVEILVLDEVDRMLDMGFVQPVRRIVAATSKKRQTLVLSATLPPDIRRLAAEMLDDPVEVAVTPAATTVEKIAQSVIHVEPRDKPALLVRILADGAIERALVFTRTKRGADKVTRGLAAAGVSAAALHGNKSQGQREQALSAFKAGRARVLVATDIAARGIDVDGITHVINFELPNIPESYVHRIGRTARAGASGSAISFCGAEERPYLSDIEKLIRMRLAAHPRSGEVASLPAPAPLPAAPVGIEAPRGSGPRPQRQPQRPARAPAGEPSRGQQPRSKPAAGRGQRNAAEPAADLSNVRFLSPPKTKSGSDTAGRSPSGGNRRRRAAGR